MTDAAKPPGALQQGARERADELPGATLTNPFGPEWDVYKVCDKVFMLLTESTGEAMVTLKARPADGRVLCEAYPQITPGYHMNKRHWITLREAAGAGVRGDVDLGLLRDLVTESYLLVLENSVPKRLWPVNPATFGQ